MYAKFTSSSDNPTVVGGESTKSLYDTCNLRKKDQESMDPFKWVTDPLPYTATNACLPFQSPFIQKNNGVPHSQIDTESQLRNQVSPLSRCPESRYDPTKRANCSICENCDSGIPCGCDHCSDNVTVAQTCENNTLLPEYTRLQKPCNLPGQNIDRFHSLPDNPVGMDLKKIYSNDFIGQNTRQSVKDEYNSRKG